MGPPEEEQEQRPGGLKLRTAHPPVVRLSRRMLIGGAAVAALAITGVVGWGLLARPSTPQSAEQPAEAPPPPEKLGELPRDYTTPRDIPKLGPPLPGDLGRPILEGPSATPPATAPPASSVDQEREAARTSRLFGLSGAPAGAAPLSSAPRPISLEATDVAPEKGAAATGLLDAPPDRRTLSPDRLAPRASPFVLQAGTVIPAALVTGIRSDLPGEVIGQVTQDIYDSVTGRTLLAPAGSRLVGRYDSQVTFGQTRVLLAWTRLLLPNGRSIVLENLPGADPAGFAGLQDRVDHHWRALLTAAAVTSLLAVGTQVQSSGSENDLTTALRRAGADSANQVGQQVVGKSLSIPPTLEVRPGMSVRVILTRDLVLEPYG